MITHGGLVVTSYPEWLKGLLDLSTGSEVWISLTDFIGCAVITYAVCACLFSSASSPLCVRPFWGCTERDSNRAQHLIVDEKRGTVEENRSEGSLSIKTDENRAGSRGCVWIKMDGQSLLLLWLSWQLCGSRKNIKHFDMYKLIGPHSAHALSFSFSVPHTHQLLYLGESHEICQEMFRSHLTPNQRIFFAEIV